MASGRPRTVCPSDDELVALGEEMVKWVRENKPAHLSKWYLQEKFIVRDAFKDMTRQPAFSPYYEAALSIVADQYIDKDSQIHPSIAQRWQRVYFKDLRDEEDETEKFKASLKKEDTKQAIESIAIMMALQNKSTPLVKDE